MLPPPSLCSTATRSFFRLRGRPSRRNQACNHEADRPSGIAPDRDRVDLDFMLAERGVGIGTGCLVPVGGISPARVKSWGKTNMLPAM